MENSLKRFREFISAPSHTRTISALAILIIAAAVPLTVLVAQRQQEVRQHAAGPTCIGSKICTSINDLKPTTGCSTCAAGTVCCTDIATPAPSGPCAKTINGKYVVGGVCSGSTLYTCNGSGGSTGSKTCTYGCQVNSGTYDTCKPAPTPNCPYSCISSAGCISANDLQPVSGYICGSGTVCCKALATPTPQCTSNSIRCTSNPAQVQTCQNGVWVTGNCGGSYVCQNTSTGAHCVLPAPTTPPTCPGSCQASSSYCGTGSYGSYNSAGNSYCNSSTNGGHPYCCNAATAQCTEGTTECVNSGAYIKCISGAWSAKYVCSTGTSCQQQTGTANPCKATPAPAPSGPCAKTINGKYVVGGVCSGSTLYTCNGSGGSTGSKTCTYGCQVNAGTYDTCKSAPAPTATPAPTAKPTCNATPANCTACVASPSNACGAAGGSKTCTYTTYNGSTNCNAITKVNLQCQPACASGTICNSSNVCIAQATNSPAPTGSGTPAPTATPAPGSTVLALNIGIDAIGSVGDNENPNPSSSNQNPTHPTRNVTVQVFDSNNNQVSNQIGSINYNAGTGIFTGAVNLGVSFVSGNYTVKVKSDGHLRRLIPGIQNISSGQTVQMPQVNLVAGDVNNDNFINITDYNILLSCVNDPDVANVDNHALCNSDATYNGLSDLDDNGVVDKFDYNLFLREYSVQNGN